MRRDLGRPRQARTRCLLVPREAQEEALELDAVVERCGREVLAAQSFVEGRGDGVREPDYSGRERYPSVAESINGLVAPSSKLASDRVGRRRGDVAVSVTGWHQGAPPGRHSRWRRRRPGARRKGWRRRRQRSSGGQLGRCALILRPLWPLVVQPKSWQARLPIKCAHQTQAK